jgi:MFS family permease
MSILTAFGALVSIIFWLPSATLASGNANGLIITFTCLYGFASGCIFSIVPALIARITPDIRKLGVRTGSLYAVAATGVLIGSPIAGVISTADGNGALGLTLFTGLLLIIGLGFVVLSRVKQTGWTVMAKA